MDLFNSVSKVSAYDVGHFAGYNSAQFATTYALSEGGGFLLNSIRSTPKIGEFGITKIDFCFIKGTLISTVGGFKNIEDIKKGDLVWSYNTEKGEKELKKVLTLSRNISSSLVKISLDGTEIICTPEHPFYVNGDWIEAKYLSKGMILTTLNGNISVVKSINFLDGNVEVYNFEVEDNHNYYVSEKGILVHNTCWRERLARFMEYAANINTKSLTSQEATINHLENVFKALDKTRTDERILKLVGETNVTVKDGIKTIYQNGSATGGNYTKVFPNGSFQIFIDHKIVINKIK